MQCTSDIHYSSMHFTVTCRILEVLGVIYIPAVLCSLFMQHCINATGHFNSRMVELQSRVVCKWPRWRSSIGTTGCHSACCVFCCSKSALGAIGGSTIYTVSPLQWHSTPLSMHTYPQSRGEGISSPYYALVFRAVVTNLYNSSD